jgi:glycosyltransferase involved in cell wall biosynthesis
VPAPRLNPEIPASELQHDVLIAGVARNCARTLPSTVQGLAAAMPRFHAVRWMVVESDSSDDTVAVLQHLAATVPGFAYRSLGALAERMPERTERLALCRNTYLDHLAELQRDATGPGTGLLVIADLDGVNDLLTAEGLRSCWARDDWSACMANQKGLYYDIWALRHAQWCPGDCWAQSRFLERYTGSAGSARKASVHARMIPIPADAPWLEVDSAFGGLALYRTAALGRARYVGLGADGQPVCEHVAFHAAMKAAGARIFINPAMVNADTSSLIAQYWPEREQITRATRSLAFRLVLRLFFGQQVSKNLRRLLQSLE